MRLVSQRQLWARPSRYVLTLGLALHAWLLSYCRTELGMSFKAQILFLLLLRSAVKPHLEGELIFHTLLLKQEIGISRISRKHLL